MPTYFRRIPTASPRETAYGRAGFGARALRDIRDSEVKAWYEHLPYGRTAEKLLTIVRAVFAYARAEGWADYDPTSRIDARPVRYSGDYDFYSCEEIDELIRAAETMQDAAIYMTAAMTGLRRGELVALRWRDIDLAGQAIRVRANYSFGQLVTPKSGRVRSVPMVLAVADALSTLREREQFINDADAVFVGPAGRHIDGASPTLRRRGQARGPPPPPLPLVAPLLRVDGCQPSIACPGPNMDGAFAHPDHCATCTRRAKPTMPIF